MYVTIARAGGAVAALVTAAWLLRADADRGDKQASRQEPTATPPGGFYVPPGHTFDFAVIRAPLPTKQVGAFAVHGLPSTGEGPVPRILGEVPAALPNADWRQKGIAEVSAQSGAGPFDAMRGQRKCQCKTSLGDMSQERIAALYATTRFAVGDDLLRVRSLRIQARYRDGIVIHVNGHEVARRNVVDGSEVRLAERTRGPETETFYVPVWPGLLKRDNNLIAVEVRPSVRRLSPLLDITVTGHTAPKVVRGPVVQRVGVDGATVVFDTDLPTKAQVEVQTATGWSSHLSAGGGLAVHHEIALTGVRGRVAYRLRVAGADVVGPYVFHTAPKSGAPQRFVVYGDVRGGHRTHGRILRSIGRESPDFVLATGDLVARGSDEGDWQRFFDVAGDTLARIPYYPAAGNHDMGRAGDERRRMSEIFALWPGPPTRPSWGHWYSFDVGDIHFVMLDSNAYDSGEQRAWLRADLVAARRRGARAMFAVTHDGPYSRGIHLGNRYAARKYTPILVKYGVSMLFSGHDHLYQRGVMDGLRYVVSGGGGAPLYRVGCGVPGKRSCPRPDGMEFVASEYHYVVLSTYRSFFRVCPKRADGTELEPCIKYRY